jgi:hypothetical protein
MPNLFRTALLLLAALAAAMPTRAQSLAETVELLRRDFAELTLQEPGLTEITPTYFVFGGRWNGRDIGAARVEFDGIGLPIDRPDGRGRLEIEVRGSGNLTYIGYSECEERGGCTGTRVQAAPFPEMYIRLRPDAPRERVAAFVSRVEHAARLNGARTSTRFRASPYPCPAGQRDCPRVTRVQLNILCNDITDKILDPDEESPFIYRYEGTMWQLAGAIPMVDTPEQAATKIRRLWELYHQEMICETLGTPNAPLMEHAVHHRFPSLLISMVRDYKLDINRYRNPRQGNRTVLDYTRWKIETLRQDPRTAPALIRQFESIYNSLRGTYGARHSLELR